MSSMPIATDTAERTVALHPLFVPHYMQFRESRLPVVCGIVTAPLVLPNGTLLAKQGLDRAHQLVYRIDPACSRSCPHPAKITPRHITAATRFLLDHWLIDVTTDLAGKMTLLAVALSIIERVLLPERPAYFITAGRRGGGKTTAILMAVAASPAGCRPPRPGRSLRRSAAKRCSPISARRSTCWSGTTSRAAWRSRAHRSRSR